MNNHFESVEERVRNGISLMWNMASIIKDLQDPNKTLKEKQILYNYIIGDSSIPDIMRKNMEYLINVAKEVDKALPKDFSINELVDYEGM